MNILKTSLKALGAFLMIAGLSKCQKSLDQPAQNAKLVAEAKAKSEKDQMGTVKDMTAKTYRVDFDALNHSGVSGKAMLTLTSTTLTVKINAWGLEANKLHPQHIHGQMDRNKQSTCPTWSADVNMDGIISLAEGLPAYGDVVLSLTPFPTATTNGEIHFEHSYSLAELASGTGEHMVDVNALTSHLNKRAIVLHGMTVNGEYIATLPVACGEVRNANVNND
jgi:hypothetical protein